MKHKQFIEKFKEESKNLSEEQKNDVLKFIEYLKYKKTLNFRDELTEDLKDVRLIELLRVDEDMYYLSRKETADHLMDKYKLIKK
jgi:hypothetical protein